MCIFYDTQTYPVYCAYLYCSSRMLHFLQVEGKALHQQQIGTCFIAVLTLLWWSGIEPAVSSWYTSTGYLTCVIQELYWFTWKSGTFALNTPLQNGIDCNSTFIWFQTQINYIWLIPGPILFPSCHFNFFLTHFYFYIS